MPQQSHSGTENLENAWRADGPGPWSLVHNRNLETLALIPAKQSAAAAKMRSINLEASREAKGRVTFLCYPFYLDCYLQVLPTSVKATRAVLQLRFRAGVILIRDKVALEPTTIIDVKNANHSQNSSLQLLRIVSLLLSTESPTVFLSWLR